MKSFTLVGLSLTLVISASAFAANEELLEQAGLETETVVLADDSAVATAIQAETATITALPTDAAVAEAVQAQADDADQTADAAVKAGAMTAAQAQGVHETTANAREASKKKGFRKKLLGALKKAGKGALFVAKGAGYAGEAVGLAFVTPIYAGVGFTAGVISGDQIPDRNPARAAVLVTSVGGGIATELGALKIASAIPSTGVVFPVSLGVLLANNVVVCGLSDARSSDYCANIAKINMAMTDGALQGSRKGGSKVHKFFARIFKRKKQF